MTRNDRRATGDRDRPADRRDRPIGFLDSGVGGLTVLHECLVSLPAEDYLYVGDSGHFPYGEKSSGYLLERAGVIAGFLLDQQVKLLVLACNSATAAAGEAVREMGREAGVPVVTVVGPEAEIAGAITENGRIGVLATPATVSSGAYHRALEDQRKALTVTEVAAPDLAPIIQGGATFSEEVVETVRGYCRPLKEARVDTLILGCTHYPLIAPLLQRILGRDVRLVTAGHAIAGAIQRRLASEDALRGGGGEGGYGFRVTGDRESFVDLGTRFLQLPLGDRVEHLEI